MKRSLPLFLLIIISTATTWAQSQVRAIDIPIEEEPVPERVVASNSQKSKIQNTLWSEDFANGIPSTWTNQGYNGSLSPLANALWEYRGPSTVPDNTVGSRGAFASGRPILSPTAANGFILFDSDFLDNNGLSNNNDNGPAPSPHVGTLITDTIDLTGFPFVELRMNVYARNFQSEFTVAISNDGGLTYVDTVRFLASLPTNSSTPRDMVVTANISSAAGNSANVKLMLLYDGRPGNANNNGLYYWCVDDIEINELPDHAFKFVEYRGAPANDILFGPGGSPRTGQMQIDEVRPISFDSNILNFGVQAQTDVVLAVDIYERNSGAFVQTLRSQPLAILNPGDTGSFNDFFTPSFTPSAKGLYEIVYRVESDSVPASTGSLDATDTIYTVNVSDSVMGLDFGNFSNSLGTPQLGDDGSALANIYHYPNPTTDRGVIEVYYVELNLSTLTVAGGDVQIEIYDTAGFDLTNGFASAAIASKPFSITSSHVGTRARFDMTDAQGAPLELMPGTYYFVAYMFSNSGASRIRIANDQAVAQGSNSIMYNTDDARWYTGYANSRTLASPWIRVITSEKVIGLEEYETLALNIYPNPVKGYKVNLDLQNPGNYSIQLVDLEGRIVSQQNIFTNGSETLLLDISKVAKGIYLVKVNNEYGSKTIRLVIQ